MTFGQPETSYQQKLDIIRTIDPQVRVSFRRGIHRIESHICRHAAKQVIGPIWADGESQDEAMELWWHQTIAMASVVFHDYFVVDSGGQKAYYAFNWSGLSWKALTAEEVATREKEFKQLRSDRSFDYTPLPRLTPLFPRGPAGDIPSGCPVKPPGPPTWVRVGSVAWQVFKVLLFLAVVGLVLAEIGARRDKRNERLRRPGDPFPM